MTDLRRIVLFVLSALALSASAARPKSVIVFIGDGMSTPQRMTAEEFARKAKLPPLAMNALPHQATTRTCSADSLVTDSAAAATALACGAKTYNGGMGVDAKGRPLVSSAEVAKRTGRRVGIVTTVTINHATPAGFYAHRKNRSDGYGIGLDLVASGFDYFAGGDCSGHGDTKHAEYKGDIHELAERAGYTIVREDIEAFRGLKPSTNKVWYVVTQGILPFAIDAADRPDRPTLAELTRKGLELLDCEEGFFLMVEGGRIDWAGHANDPATNLREVMALDEAVRVALEFQKTHPDTLVVTTGDHETGGMTMGFAATGYAFYMDRLANQKCSTEAFEEFLKRAKPTDFGPIRLFLESNFGFVFEPTDKKDPMALSAEDVKAFKEAFAHDLELARKGQKDAEAYDAEKITRLPTVVKATMSHKCGIGWSSGAHTALPVLTTAKGPGAERFVGFIDNTDVSKILKELLAR